MIIIGMGGMVIMDSNMGSNKDVGLQIRRLLGNAIIYLYDSNVGYPDHIFKRIHSIKNYVIHITYDVNKAINYHVLS